MKEKIQAFKFYSHIVATTVQQHQFIFGQYCFGINGYLRKVQASVHRYTGGNSFANDGIFEFYNLNPQANFSTPQRTVVAGSNGSPQSGDIFNFFSKENVPYVLDLPCYRVTSTETYIIYLTICGTIAIGNDLYGELYLTFESD
jgi:hypothetical protein